MKNLTLLFTLLCIGIYGQNQYMISKKISDKVNAKQEVKNISLFSRVENQKVIIDEKIKDKSATSLKIENAELSRILNQKPEIIKITVPYDQSEVKVILLRNNFLSQDFAATTNDRKKINYTPGVYYHGIIEGDETSFVTFSFFNDDIKGLVINKQNLNLSIVKNGGAESYLSYATPKDDMNLPSCGTKDDVLTGSYQPQVQTNKSAKVGIENCIRIYYEISFSDFKEHNSSTVETLNWITAMHNTVSSVFANENVASLMLSEVFIWQVQDPYKALGLGDSMLTLFQSNRPTYNGDLAHLISTDVTDIGGIAALNGLCTTWGHGLTNSSSPEDLYKIKIICHEIGHNLSSPHTHACRWNGNNTAIDGCETTEWGSCPNPGIPAVGTIMSYCMNKSLSFGVQPATLMRNYVASVNCLQQGCSLAQFQVITTTNNSNAGVVQGGGTYFNGSQVSIKAIPNPGYVFLRWEKYEGTSNQRTIIYEDSPQFFIGNNYRFDAFFQYVGLPTTDPDKASIIVISNPAEGGVTTGSGTYPKWTNFTIRATPNAGYNLQGWTAVDMVSNNRVFLGASPTFALQAFYHTIFIANFAPLLSANNVTLQQKIAILPNPSNHLIVIQNSQKNNEEFNYKIFDLSGKLVQIGESVFNAKVDIKGLPKGSYLIVVETKDGQNLSLNLLKN